MNKAELIKEVKNNYEFGADVKKADIENAIEATFDVIAETLAKGEEVKIPKFGIFSITERAERTGRNPQTGEPLVIPATKAVRFKVSSTLRAAVK